MERSRGATVVTPPSSGQDVTRPRWVSAMRERVIGLPGGLTIWRVTVAVVGFLIVAGGVVMLPFPGPGWVVIFLGLGAWATEFRWAGRLLLRVKRLVQSWSATIKALPVWGKVLVGLAVLLVIAAIAGVGWWYYFVR